MLGLINKQNRELIFGGIKWELELQRRLADPIFLESHGYEVYSQNDEDGIISEISRRIGTTDKRFIEFGVGNGLQCNSHYLLFKGWHGLWIEASSCSCEQIQTAFKSVLDNGRLKVVNSFITRDNINKLFEDAGFTGELDLLSIDIDANDYHVWEAINVVNPRVVVIEYNAKFPPDCEWVMPYKANYVWDGSDKQGASLKSYELLGRKKGYTLVGTGLNGVNAFFVRDDLVNGLFPTPATAENLYNSPKWSYTWKTGPEARYCLVDDDNHVNEQLLAAKNMKIVTENIKSRNVLIWGGGMGLRPVRCALRAHNINEFVCFDSKRTGYEYLENENILDDFSLVTKDKYYIIISTLNYYEEIETSLRELGFSVNSDYIYFFYNK